MLNFKYFYKIFGVHLLGLKIRAKFKFISFKFKTATKRKLIFNFWKLQMFIYFLIFPKSIYLRILDFGNYFF